MFLKKFNFLSWNVRGLGCPRKCNVVRNIIKSSRCDVCLLQETKCNEMDVSISRNFLPSFFNQETAFNVALSSAGGVLIAWKKSFSLVSSWSTRHSITVLLQQASSGKTVMITNVYGPSDDASKPSFIRELHSIAAVARYPWILAGDFNLTRWLIDRPSSLRGFRLMELFNDFIAANGIVDTPLKNRSYTWSCSRPIPSFSKIDRIFTSTDWTVAYPIITLEALETLISDHAPLLLRCKGVRQSKKSMKLETFWFRYDVPREMVRQLWGNGPVSDTARESDPFLLNGFEPVSQGEQTTLLTFHQKTQLLHRGLRLWHSQTFGQLDKRLKEYRDEILLLDRKEEARPLNPTDLNRRTHLRALAYDMAINLEERWRQRSRCNWLSLGDRNTRFFHSMASTRLRRNLVLTITDGELVLSDKV